MDHKLVESVQSNIATESFIKRSGNYIGRILVLLLIAASPPAWPEAIQIGSIATLPGKELRIFQPIADYLAAHLGSQGIDRGIVVIAGSMEEMASLIRERKVDIYVDSPFPTFVVSKLSQSQPLLRRWKNGVRDYYSVIFVRKDSGLRRVEDLRGKVLAFEDPFSTSSYFLPKASLIRLGERLTEAADSSAKVKPEEIGFVFTDDDHNTLLWVLRGRVPAGAMNSLMFKRLARRRPNDFLVIHETRSVPRHLVSHRPDLDPRVVQRVKEVFLTMHRSEEGRKILQAFEKTAKFEEFSVEPEKVLAPIGELVEHVASEFGQ